MSNCGCIRIYLVPDEQHSIPLSISQHDLLLLPEDPASVDRENHPVAGVHHRKSPAVRYLRPSPDEENRIAE